MSFNIFRTGCIHYRAAYSDHEWDVGNQNEYRMESTGEYRFRTAMQYAESIRIAQSIQFAILDGDSTPSTAAADGSDLAQLKTWMQTDCGCDSQYVIGNHEWAAYYDDMDKFSNNIINTNCDNAFTVSVNGKDLIAAYSFDKGNYHFVILGTCYPLYPSYTDKVTGKTQDEWLMDDLTATNKPVFVFCHTHILQLGDATYTYNSYGSTIVETLEDIETHGANVVAVFMGHWHNGDVHCRKRQNGIVYIPLKGSVNTRDEEAWVAHLIKILDKTYYTPYGWKNYIEIDGLGTAKSMEKAKMLVA